MKEIDDFLPRWVTPALAPLGFRKSSHTYRRCYPNGDWTVFSFRARPLPDVRGNFLVDASFIPEPLFDWFNFANPDLTMNRPTGWWIDWGTPLKALHGNDWQYQSDAEREICGAFLEDRLTEVATLFGRFAAEPDLLVSMALAPDEWPQCESVPLFAQHLRKATWRTALLIRRGSTPELEQTLAECDPHPHLRMREWVDSYLARAGA